MYAIIVSHFEKLRSKCFKIISCLDVSFCVYSSWAFVSGDVDTSGVFVSQAMWMCAQKREYYTFKLHLQIISSSETSNTKMRFAVNQFQFERCSDGDVCVCVENLMHRFGTQTAYICIHLLANVCSANFLWFIWCEAKQSSNGHNLNGQRTTSAFVKLHRHHVWQWYWKEREREQRKSGKAIIEFIDLAMVSIYLQTRTVPPANSKQHPPAHRANKFASIHMSHFEFENISFVCVHIYIIHIYKIHILTVVIIIIRSTCTHTIAGILLTLSTESCVNE